MSLFKSNNKIIFILLLYNYTLFNIFCNDYTFKIHFLYVGAANCTIIEYKKNKNKYLFIVDCGENVSILKKTNTIEYLCKLGAPKKNNSSYDYNCILNVILSHPHVDHYYNLDKINSSFNINMFYYSNMYEDYKSIKFVDKYLNTIFYKKKCFDIVKLIPKNRIKKIFSGDIIFEDENLKIDVLWPEKNYKYKNNDFNDNSIVLLISIDKKKILIMSDTGIKAEKEIIKKYKNTKIFKNIEVIEIGHHGNNSSSSEEFVNLFKPKFIINSTGPHPLTCGLCNLHQRRKVIKKWKKRCKKLLTTYNNGNIILKYNKKTKTFNLKK